MIGICGYGLTGSDAVINLLKEFDNVTIVDDREFVLTYFPGGLEDLEYHLMLQNSKFYSADVAINNFKRFTKAICHNKKSFYYKLTDGHFSEFVDEYLNSIIDIKWNGRWMYDDYIFNSFYQKFIYAIKKRIKFLDKYTFRTMYYSIKPQNFYSKTTEFLEKVYNYRNKPEPIVLDQAFPANNPERSMKLFGKNAKAVIVMRDLRDLYIAGKTRKKNIHKTLWMPCDNVKDFIIFYKKMFDSMQDNPNIMYIYLEDLIYKYEESINKVIDFCKLDKSKHIRKKEVFSPEKSMKNTRLFDRYKEYDEDIKIISQEMSDYLFDYSKI